MLPRLIKFNVLTPCSTVGSFAIVGVQISDFFKICLLRNISVPLTPVVLVPVMFFPAMLNFPPQRSNSAGKEAAAQ